MGCETALVKYSVSFINLIFLFVGIALMAVGVFCCSGIDVVKKSLGSFRDVEKVVPTIVIVLGCLVFFIAFLGCFRSIRKSICEPSKYGVIMLILFLFQVGLGAYAVITYRNASITLKDDISNKFKDEIKNWDGKDQVDVGIDAKQQIFKCCGAISPYDWEGNIPKSCCKDRDSCSSPPSSAQIFNDGCVDKIFDVVENVSEFIVIVVFTIAAFELAAAIVAFCLSSCIRNNIRRGYY